MIRLDSIEFLKYERRKEKNEKWSFFVTKKNNYKARKAVEILKLYQK